LSLITAAAPSGGVLCTTRECSSTAFVLHEPRLLRAGDLYSPGVPIYSPRPSWAFIASGRQQKSVHPTRSRPNTGNHTKWEVHRRPSRHATQKWRRPPIFEIPDNRWADPTTSRQHQFFFFESSSPFSSSPSSASVCGMTWPEMKRLMDLVTSTKDFFFGGRASPSPRFRVCVT